MAARTKRGGMREPDFDDVQAVCQAIAEEYNAKVRIVTRFDYVGQTAGRAQILVQAYQVQNGTPWVLLQRECYWPNTQGTTYAVSVMMGCYRLLHGLADVNR